MKVFLRNASARQWRGSETKGGRRAKLARGMCSSNKVVGKHSYAARRMVSTCFAGNTKGFLSFSVRPCHC